MVIDSLPGVFYLFDTRGKVLRWNHNVELATGYTFEEISQMKSLDFIVDADRKPLKDTFSRVFENGEAASEAHYLTKSGDAIPYYFTGKMIEIDGAECALGVGIDISDRRHRERDLRESRRTLPKPDRHYDGGPGANR